MSLDDSQFLYNYNCKIAKEMWDTLKMIYGVSPSVKQEQMNTRGEEDEYFIHKCFFKFRYVRNGIRMYVTNKYLRVKNWNQKSGPILKSTDKSV